MKLKESQLTDPKTDFKGSLNDPELEIIGFDQYNIKHETYALTRLIYFIMTGKTVIRDIKDKVLETFVIKGINKILEVRYKDIQELRTTFQKI